MRTVHARRRPPAPMRVFLQQHSSRGAGAEKHWLWLTPLAPEVCKKPGKPYCLPGFLHTLPSKPPGQSCAPPRKRQLWPQSRQAFRSHPLLPSRKHEEAVRKNCLPGAMALCASGAFSRGPCVLCGGTGRGGGPPARAGGGAARSARAMGAMHAPGAPAEQCQNGKYLKAAQQHVCREHQL